MDFRCIRTCYTGVSTSVLILLYAVLGAVAPAPAAAEPFSLVCMPDPQYYTTSDHPQTFDLYSRQARWIRDNKTPYNIQHVIWLGDLTNNNRLDQWAVAREAYNILDFAQIPFAVVPGNHDYITNNSDGWAGAHFRDLRKFNAYVGPHRFNNKAWYGGNMGETTDHNENNYTYFSSSGLDFMVIGLEYAPRKEVLTWANNLISQHPNHRVILFTHGYMGNNGVYVGNAGSAAATVGASGAEIFDECASRHSNVFMVVCGHVTESVVNSKVGVGGNIVYEMLVDYQSEKVKGTGANLGNGWLRVLRFDPANNIIRASTLTPAAGDDTIFRDGITKFYSTRYNSSPLGGDHLFTLSYNMQPLGPYTYLNRSVEFHAMSVNNDLHGDQLDPDIGQADNGDWATVWEDDSDQNGIYEIVVRGFDSDGNVRFEKSVANTTGANVINATNPSMAMASDGSFVVVWQYGPRDIKYKLFNADGTPVSADDQTVASVAAPGTISNPDVAIDEAGNFVVAWADDTDGDSFFDISARGLKSDSTERFARKTVNTILSGQQLNPIIAMAGNGDYVIAWEDDRLGTWDLGMRGFRANETQRFPQTFANFTTQGEQISPAIAMDDTGRFVVVWEDDADLNNAYQIRARGFSGSGAQLFSERTVNIDSSANQINPAVSMDAAGNWYPVWEDNGVSGQGYQMMSNAFNIAGSRINSSDVRANPVTSVSHGFGPETRKSPVVSGHKSGRYIVAWADDMDGDGAFQVLARGMRGTARSLAIKSINGSVVKSPDDAFYAPGASVTLTASANPGSSFIRWSGDVPEGSATANPLTITMDASKVVTAEFTEASDVGEWQLY